MLSDLPPKVVIDVPCPLSTVQQALYQQLVSAEATLAHSGENGAKNEFTAARSRYGASSSISDDKMMNKGGGSTRDPPGTSAAVVSATRGLGLLRTLSLLCTHPCLAFHKAGSKQRTPREDPARKSREKGRRTVDAEDASNEVIDDDSEEDLATYLVEDATSDPRERQQRAQYDSWLADSGVSGKLRCLTELLAQCGLVPSSSTRLRGNGDHVGVIDENGSSSDGEDDADEKLERRGGQREGEAAIAGTGTSGAPLRKFLVFAQHRACLDLVETCVLRRYFPQAEVRAQLGFASSNS